MTGWGINPGPYIAPGVADCHLCHGPSEFCDCASYREGVLVVASGDRPKPYTRVTAAASKRKTVYLTSQRWLGGYLRLGALTDVEIKTGTSPFLTSPYLFGLAIDVPTTAKGDLPGRAGDYDNYVKSWLDAMPPVGITKDDDLRWYRGPVAVRRVAVMASVDRLWRFHWRIERV